MKLLIILAAAFVFPLAAASFSAAADETIEIPLDRIWSNAARGARPWRQLEPEFDVKYDTPEKIAKYRSMTREEHLEESRRIREQSLSIQVERGVGTFADKGDLPRPGFAVTGSDRDALPGVRGVIVKGEKPRTTFPEGSEISILFHTRQTPPAVIEKIERQGTLIIIHYMLIITGLGASHRGLALIPLGELPAGDYRVEMVRSPNGVNFQEQPFPPPEKGAEAKYVCKPFQFTVQVKEPDEKTH